MKKTLLSLLLLTSISAFASEENSLIKQYDRDTIVPETSNGTFIELNKEQCEKVIRSGAAHAYGSDSSVKTRTIISNDNCKAHFIAKKIKSKLSQSNMSCYKLGFGVLGERSRNIKYDNKGEQSFFKAETETKIDNILSSDCFCTQRTMEKRYVSTLYSVVTSPFASFFNGLTVNTKITEKLLDVDSCLDVVEDDPRVSDAISEAYREVDEELNN